MRLPIAPEGRAFVAVPLVLAILTLATAGAVFAGIGWGLLAGAGFCAFFFRDPERRAPGDAAVLLAPADGRVTEAGPADEGEPGTQRVSIFLSIFDVHINRSPAAGEIRAVRYRQGAFRAAFRKDAAERNERNELEMTTERGTIRIRQIAGVVARRIVCRVRAGDRLALGERFGLIRFGSRTDLLLPAGVTLSVRPGDRVRGGLTVIGRWE
ncbi:MAG: phosphatidylserine decarboxylase [Acidobacteria bacterium]|nr:phosphatidylserine decarboxylase [Acidobacteriota bacterium]MYA47111.1 phosphatidylserine decarboxylase [Acidobacteriota bacterium]MYI40280.1 phosphatidylserine decarboxylase [Acidobacteriota bacterium]